MGRNKGIESTSLTFRIPLPVLEQLDEMCRFSNAKRSELLINLITVEYDKLQGNPKFKEIIQKMAELESSFRVLAPGTAEEVRKIRKKNSISLDDE